MAEPSQPGRTVLLIEDDDVLRKLLGTTLERAGFKAVLEASGEAGLRSLYAHQPDLVVLDIMMPGMDGWETCRLIRLVSDVPVIMLTALGSELDVIRGLDAGADDFITKPVSSAVLLARMRAVWRRVEDPGDASALATFRDQRLVIDLQQRYVAVHGETVSLTRKEYDLLALLLGNAGRVLTYRQILEGVWGWEYQDEVHYVHIYVSHLRRKLEEDPKEPVYILTERGVGYRFARP